MNFIKKNYEKLILAVLLAVFIILLALQLILWKESSAIQVEKLKQFRDPPPNYVAVKFEDRKAGYMVLETLQESSEWGRSAARGTGSSKVYTDFMQPYAMTVCPHCVRVIPSEAFPKPNTLTTKPCPLCQKDLHAPQRPDLHVMLDTDGDGIPDRDEKVLGLNINDPIDGLVDSDADDFSNYEEYLFKTKLNDSKNHPPYYTMLHVGSIVRPALPFRLKKVTVRDPKNLSSAMIQVEVDVLRKPSQDRILRLGSKFDTMAGIYEIVDIKYVTRKNSMGIVVREYEIIVSKRGSSERIPMKVRQRVLEPRYEIHMVRSYMGKSHEFELYAGSEFKLGSMKTGIESYKVLSMNLAKKEVVLLFNGKKVTVGPESLVSKKIKQAPKVVRPPRKKKKQ